MCTFEICWGYCSARLLAANTPGIFPYKGSLHAGLAGGVSDKPHKEYPIDFMSPDAPRIPYWKLASSNSNPKTKDSPKNVKGRPMNSREIQSPITPTAPPPSKSIFFEKDIFSLLIIFKG